MDARGIALGFFIIGFAGGAGLYLATVALRYVLSQARSHGAATAGAVAQSQRDLTTTIVYGVIFLAGLGLMLLTARTIYNVILG